jgi:lycopene cyclase domain-containing protein
MAVARHGAGPVAAAGALWSQVHPVFMLPPLAAALFGGLTAGGPNVASAPHVVAVFAAVYVAHVRDGYVDFHRRGEDDDHPLTVAGCHGATVGASLLFAVCLAVLAAVGRFEAVALTAPTWALGYFHAGTLDERPLTATLDYPAGVALAILGGAAAAGPLGATSLGFALVFLVVLAGVKVVDDAQDFGFDRSIGKCTLAVAVGRGRAWETAYGLMAAGVGLAVVLSVGGVLPAGTALAALAFGAVAALAARSPDPELSTMLLVRGAYVFLAFCLVVVGYRPLAGLPLPDIGVLGPYTYLATEVLFGAAAVALLVRAGREALSRALLTVAALYPVAFVWDWYTLRVGVFAIELRTGVDLLGIPVEEHLFMFVVPALVVGIHETLHGRPPNGQN